MASPVASHTSAEGNFIVQHEQMLPSKGIVGLQRGWCNYFKLNFKSAQSTSKQDYHHGSISIKEEQTNECSEADH